MDLGHGVRHLLVQFDDVWGLVVEGLLDVGVESARCEHETKGCLSCDLPWIDVDGAQLQLLHDGAKGGHAARDVLGLVGERFQEALLVLLAIQPDDKGLRGRGCYPSLHFRFSQKNDMIRAAHLSAWRTRIPVMRWVGMSDVSMSTVKIWDVIDTRPPLLYRSCLYPWNENVRFRAPRTARKS